MSRRAVTLIEVLISGLISAIVLAVFVPQFTSLYAVNNFILQSPPVFSNATDMVNLVARDLRRSALVNNAPITSGAASAVTIYTDTSGDTITYDVSGGYFRKTITGGTAINLFSTATLTLTYYESATYNSSGLAAYAPASLSDFQQLVAVKILGTVTRNAYVGSYTTLVRLRNSPVKAVPFS